jgi:rhodanese-related sulfurtransferase
MPGRSFAMKTIKLLAAFAAAAAVVAAGCSNGTETPRHAISLSESGPYAFPSASPPVVTPLEVTVTNTGSGPTGGLTVGLAGDTSGFVLSTQTMASIPVGGDATFTLYPRIGLPNGTYNATVTVSGEAGSGMSAQSFGVSLTATSAAITISHSLVHRMMSELTGYLILDVRTEDEYRGDDEPYGRVEGAVWLHYDNQIPDSVVEFMERVDEVLPDKNQVILVYCRVGRRSWAAAVALAGLDYVNVYDFGGILNPSWPYGLVSDKED